MYIKQGQEASFSYGLRIHAYDEETMTFEGLTLTLTLTLTLIG